MQCMFTDGSKAYLQRMLFSMAMFMLHGHHGLMFPQLCWNLLISLLLLLLLSLLLLVFIWIFDVTPAVFCVSSLV